MSSTSKVSSFFTWFDMYTTPFSFNVHGSNKGYSTFTGGTFSLMMIIVVSIYSVYTFSKWLTGGFEINTSYLTTYEKFKYQTNFSPIQFGFLQYWDTVPNINSYITFRLQSVQTYSGWPYQYTKLNTTKCSNVIDTTSAQWINYAPFYKKFECIDYPNTFINGKPLVLENQGKSFLQLDFFRCNQNDPVVKAANTTCATPDEIDNFLLSFTTRLVLNAVDMDYDTDNKTYIYSIKDTYFNPSLKSVTWVGATANGADLVIINDTILNKANKEPMVQDTVVATDNFDRQEYLRKFKEFDEYWDYPDQLSDHILRMEYRLSNKVKKTTIVFPRLDSVLASLFAFTKVIFSLGILFSILNSVYSQDKMLRSICSSYYQQQSGFQLNMSGLKRAFHYATDGRYLTKQRSKGDKQKEKEELQQQQLYKAWIELSNRFTNINNLYKELMLIRNAVSLLFTKEQWAAIMFTGRRLEVLKNIVADAKQRTESVSDQNQQDPLTLNDSKSEKLRQIVREKVEQKFSLKEDLSYSNEDIGQTDVQQILVQDSDVNVKKSSSINSIDSIEAEFMDEQVPDVIELKSKEQTPNHLESIELLSLDKNFHAEMLEQFLSKSMERKLERVLSTESVQGQDTAQDQKITSYEQIVNDRIYESLLNELVLEDKWNEQVRDRIKLFARIN